MRSLPGQSAAETHQPLIHNSSSSRSSGNNNNNNRSHTTTRSFTHRQRRTAPFVMVEFREMNQSWVMSWCKIWRAMLVQFWGPKKQYSWINKWLLCYVCVNWFFSKKSTMILYQLEEKSSICIQPVFFHMATPPPHYSPTTHSRIHCSII